jgi:ubiquinone/menaquinone biosynthesis C-methylase UbiE
VLDVACGCGIKSLALAQVDPGVRVTCVDSADVLEVTRDLAGRLAVLPQVTFLPGDLHTMDLGVEACDAALLGQITYYLTPGQNLDLFQRMFGALSPGGTLVIDALMTAEEPDEVGSQFTALLRALTDGAAHPFADYRTWLEGAGFAQTRQLSDRWLSATRA